MGTQEIRHMRKLLDAMLNKKDVWVPHYQEGWIKTYITAINRSGSVTVESSRGKWKHGVRGFHACESSDVHLTDPLIKESNDDQVNHDHL